MYFDDISEYLYCMVIFLKITNRKCFIYIFFINITLSFAEIALILASIKINNSNYLFTFIETPGNMVYYHKLFNSTQFPQIDCMNRNV